MVCYAPPTMVDRMTCDSHGVMVTHDRSIVTGGNVALWMVELV